MIKTQTAIIIAAALFLVIGIITMAGTCNANRTLAEVKDCTCTADSTGRDTITRRNTEYGMMQQQDTIENTMASMRYAGIDIVRVPLYFDDAIKNNKIDKYLAAGFRVQINFNYKATGATVPFPTDTNFIRDQAEAFFNNYKDRRDKIPLVVIENEWDNMEYHENSLIWYVQELNIVTRVAHKYGFKVADAGITSANLQRWVYSKLEGEQATWWKQHYFVGLDNEYEFMTARVNAYFAAIVQTDIDYINFHWYNNGDCPKGLAVALSYMPQRFEFITNEWGVKQEYVYACTLNEMRSVKPAFCIIYSGVNAPGKAIRISDDNLKEMSVTFP